MNPVAKSIALILLMIPVAQAKEDQSIREFVLDEYSVYTIPVASNRVTTISFPGPISAIDAALITMGGKTAGLFQLAHTKGTHFFSVRALQKRAKTNLNVRWNRKTFVLELVESATPYYSVILKEAPPPILNKEAVAVTPHRLLAVLDKAKAYSLLKTHHPDAVAHIEYLQYAEQPRVIDYQDFEIQIEEVFRFDPEDTLVFRVLLRNKSDQVIAYRSDGFSVRVGDRTYFQSVSDASGMMPPKSDSPAYFAITGTPDGGRNDLSLKNDFIVILPRNLPPQVAKPSAKKGVK